MQGYCSINADAVDQQLKVICRLEEDKYQKHFLGYSDNVTYTVEQLDASSVSDNHYKIVFRPQTILPIVETDIQKPEHLIQ